MRAFTPSNATASCHACLMSDRLYDERLGAALAYVAEVFATKRRKGGQGAPYLCHLLAVTSLVLEHGGTEDEAIAAVLHDVLEDIPGSEIQHLTERFGEPVTTLVIALSDSFRPGDKEPWRERKERHLAALRHAEPGVKRVAIADKVHNAGALLDDVRRLGAQAFVPFNGGQAGTLWYYRAALEARADAPAPGLRARFSEIVEALERA